ncbi:MAG: hypothetical protein AAF442_06225 [Pseudomonadota bacterium]
MAFSKKNLAAIAYADGQTTWQYKTDDDANAIQGKGYFNDASHMLKEKDFILISYNGGFAIYQVKTSTGGAVTLETAKITSE